MKGLLICLRGHGVACFEAADGSSIRVLSTYTRAGEFHAEWATISGTWSAVRSYLGY